jgi:hypothetical protein
VGRFDRSWEIARSSARVLKADKELAALPLLGFLASMSFILLTGGAIWFSLGRTTDLVTGATEYNPTPLTYGVGIVGYLLATFAGIFFTAALVAGAHERLTGGNPTFGTALEAAARRIGPIFGWSVIVTTVGLVLHVIEQRGIIGNIVARVVGAAWRIVTWLAIPVVVVEGAGPIGSLKKSAALFKQTWGENLVAQVGFGLIGFLAILPGIALGLVVGSVVPIAGIVIGGIEIAAVSVVLAALNGIYRTALYLYAETGQVPQGFAPEVVASAFGPRKKSSVSLLR